jgi:4'-phosphopantetheinyl transferase
VAQLWQTLTPDERVRAERFYFEQHRQHFIVGRGVLRAILASYLGIEPAALRFHYGPRGKPALQSRPNGPSDAVGRGPLQFNMAHSHGIVLYAVAQHRELGVDVEYVRPVAQAGRIVERYFTARENAVYCALPADQQPAAFFNGWTRKEAYLKARGDGLARPLSQVEVSLAPGEPARLLSIGGDPQEAARWSLREVAPAAGWVAALCVEGSGWHLACWQWPAM